MNKEYELGILEDEKYLELLSILATSNVPVKKTLKFNTYIINLWKENKKLKERIEYLERSNNRREDTILSLRNKISDLEDNRELEKELDK